MADTRRGMRLHIFSALIVLLISSACAPAADQGRDLRVFAAASLTGAFEELAQQFEVAHPGVDLVLNFGGSSILATQLVEGAPGDIFASADQAQMQVVVAAGLAAGQPRAFAGNSLTIILPADNPGGLENPTDLARPGIKLILAAPGVPARGYSDQVIRALGDADFQRAVYANLVSEEENVRQVVTKVTLGEADAGIVYLTDASAYADGELRQIPIPPVHNVTASYPVVQLAHAANAELAGEFIEFLLSGEGQAILLKWGFAPALD